MTKLNEVIGFDKKTDTFVVGSHDIKGNEVKASAPYTQRDADMLLREVYGAGERSQHEMVAATLVEPIEKVVPYAEMFNIFFMEQNYQPLDDNSIPVEDTVTMAWQTHQDSAVLFTRSGFYWTRPTFNTWDAGIDVPWAMVEKAGWNFLARQMRRVTEDLARKRDAQARAVLDAAILNTHTYSVATTLTKTIVDTVLKDQATIGFPVRKVLINAGRIMDMATFTWPTGFLLPEARAEQLIRTLYLGEYGGASWFANPHAPTNVVYFGGEANQIGWHQTRGAVKQASDVDIRNKRDLYAIYDQEHAHYVDSVYTLAKINIT